MWNLTGQEILPSDQNRIIEQAKFTHSPLDRSFEIQIKITEDQGRKQDEVLEVLKPKENKQSIKPVERVFPKEPRTNEIKIKINENQMKLN